MDIDQGYGNNLERRITFPNDDDYSSRHDYHKFNYHRIDEHLQTLGIRIMTIFQRSR